MTSDSAARSATRNSHVSPHEAELIRRICNGEKEEFYALVHPYERAVYSIAMSIVQNSADAEEVAQEAILKAFSHLRSFRGEAKFSTWLIQIALNEARLKLRKDRRHLHESLDDRLIDGQRKITSRDFADLRGVPSDALERKELRQALQRCLKSLPPKYREVFVLRDIRHLTIREVSEILRITEGSIKTRLLRARLQMRKALGPGFDNWSHNPRTARKKEEARARKIERNPSRVLAA
jgi:RNA polymerase sigma-70 factor (ECF subfamily)